MELAAITPRLSERRIARLAEAIAKLESAIASGVVPNAMFTEAKETINRAVEEAVSHWQNETGNYSLNTLIMGAYNVPAGIKEATKSGHAMLPLLAAMLPLAELIKAAKPLIVKRGQAGAPAAPKSAEQLAREAAVMTCQCCGKGFLANTGTMAHHGYQRPGQGWQTASCPGAKFLPFEASSARLALLIEELGAWKARQIEYAARLEAETESVSLSYRVGKSWEKQRLVTFELTRETFEAKKAEHAGYFRSRPYGFEFFKAEAIQSVQSQIKGVEMEIAAQQERLAAWPGPSAKFEAKEWKPL